MRELLRGIACIALCAVPALAQETRGATIVGTVRDSASQPIPAADVVAQPGGYRTRTDSAGNFMFTGLGGGAYTVAARKVGYAPDRWEVSVSKNGRVAIAFVLGRRTQLDTVVVTAKSPCSLYSLDGFDCRRRAGRGLFLDYQEIDERRPLYTADVFRDIPGFRVEVHRSRYGPVRVPVAANGYGCIAHLVDGHPASPARPVPQNPSDLVAMEVYFKADSVPEQYQRYTWPAGDVVRSGRCSVVIYWTLWAPMTPR